MADSTTVVIPFGRRGRRDWLDQAIKSIPAGTPYIVAENDGEFAQAMNAAVEAASTDYVMFLGADDKLTPDTLNLLESLAWDVDVTYPTQLMYGEEMGVPVDKVPARPFCPHRLQVWNYIPGVSLARRSAVLASGGFKQLEQSTHEDWDLWVRMLRNDCRFKAVPEAIVRVRRVAGSKSSQARDKQDPQLLQSLWNTIVGGVPEFHASFYYQESFPTTYLRALLPSRHLPGVAYDYPTVQEVSRGGRASVHFPTHVGAAVWQFPGDPARGLLIQQMQEQGIPVLVEVDDDYRIGSHGFKTGWVTHLKDATADLPHSFDAHRRITQAADGVIVTTDQLAKSYRKLNPHVYVCPNQVDPEDWEEPAAAKQAVLDQLGQSDDDTFRIGWYGSSYHVIDAPLVKKALEWASKQDGVEVVMMGVFPRSWEFRRKYVNWSNDLGVYRRSLSLLDVGLAPIRESSWSVGKSDVKALEYAMAGALPIVSDLHPYRNLDHGSNCLKANDGRGFAELVRWAVRNRDDARRLADDARRYVLAERTMQTNVWRWQEAIDETRGRVRAAA